MGPVPRLLAISVVIACGKGGGAPATLVINGDDFSGDAFFREQTCEGLGLAPHLAWSGAPAQTKTFAVVVEDLDSSPPGFIHWLVANLPARSPMLGGDHYPPEATVGKNDFGNVGYGPPCPPSGVHRYVFHVYALDTAIGKPDITRPELDAAIKGHVVAQGEMTKTYGK